MPEQSVIEAAVAAIEATGDFRLLRRLRVEDLSQVASPSFTDLRVVALDVETTGLDPTRDRVIELAARPFWANPETCEVINVEPSYTWLEDPGRALSPEITALTGLVDADLVGQAIDERAALALLASADLIVAHHAVFDRPFVEHRLPAFAGRRWACSCAEVDWRTHGFNGRALGWLLSQAGLFQSERSHRAGVDVDALVGLLAHRLPTGATVLKELYDTASKPTLRFLAVGAHFDVKDDLKAHGYAWDGAERVWRREIAIDRADDERAWLAEHVYAPQHRPRMSGPAVAEVTWNTRHAG
jgi:DNA polymerase III subunit epsilon